MVGDVALVSMFVIVFAVLVRGPSVDPSLRGSDENVFSVLQPRVFEAIGVISFAVRPLLIASRSIPAHDGELPG